MKVLKRLFQLLLGLVLVAAGVLSFNYFHRPGLDEYAAHQLPPAPPDAKGLTATWFGTTAVLLSDGESSLFVDPFITRPAGWLRMLSNRPIAPDDEKIARTLSKAKPKNLKAVLVSHSHHDHAMDAGVVARLTDAVLVGSESTLNIGRGSGVPELQLRRAHPGVAMTFGAFTVTFIESKHAGATGGKPTGDIVEPLTPRARYLDYKQGGTYSILIEHALGTVLFHGSAGVVPGALKGRRADWVLLGVALVDNYDAYLRELVDATGATRVIPIHWDDFTRPFDDPPIPNLIGVDLPQFFAEMARTRPQIQVQTLAFGEPTVLRRPQ